MGDLVDPEQDPVDELPAIGKEPVSRKGDLWLLDRHGCVAEMPNSPLTCMDSWGGIVPSWYSRIRPIMSASQSIQGRGRTQHREFVEASGELSPDQFTQFLTDCLSLVAQHPVAGSIHFVFMDWHHFSEMSTAGKAVYSEFKNLIVWVKTNAGQGSFYRSQHELIFVFKNGDAPHINNFELGQHGRNRSVLHKSGILPTKPRDFRRNRWKIYELPAQRHLARDAKPPNGDSFVTSYRKFAEPGLAGWGGRIRTSGWRNQNPLPYHLATPQRAGCSPPAGRTIAVPPPRINAALRMLSIYNDSAGPSRT
ncbi:MAG: hypothetical protein QOJ96_1352 [Alphaproteobacteria bacterium]|nr:hypothetical protein [Alphaproteobacteria bacterium]